jgi:hypothetical protein
MCYKIIHLTWQVEILIRNSPTTGSGDPALRELQSPLARWVALVWAPSQGYVADRQDSLATVGTCLKAGLHGVSREARQVNKQPVFISWTSK